MPLWRQIIAPQRVYPPLRWAVDSIQANMPESINNLTLACGQDDEKNSCIHPDERFTVLLNWVCSDQVGSPGLWPFRQPHRARVRTWVGSLLDNIHSTVDRTTIHRPFSIFWCNQTHHTRLPELFVCLKTCHAFCWPNTARGPWFQQRLHKSYEEAVRPYSLATFCHASNLIALAPDQWQDTVDPMRWSASNVRRHGLAGHQKSPRLIAWLAALIRASLNWSPHCEGHVSGRPHPANRQPQGPLGLNLSAQTPWHRQYPPASLREYCLQPPCNWPFDFANVQTTVQCPSGSLRDGD